MKNLPSLHEIQLRHNDLFTYLAENDGDITGQEEYFDRVFNELDQDTTDKFNNIGLLLEALEANKESCKRLSDKFANNAKRAEKAIQSIKLRALQFMQATNRDRIDGIFKYSIAKNPVSVVIIEDDAQLYPETLLKTKVEISKTQIKEWMQERKLEVLEIDGKEYARLEQTVRLSIK